MLGFNKKDEGGRAFDDHDVDDGFTRTLISARKSEIKAFAEALKNPSVLAYVSTQRGDEAFSDLVALAVRDYGVSQRKLASAVGVSVATVSRWVGGMSLPSAYARAAILGAISSIIEHDLSLS